MLPQTLAGFIRWVPGGGREGREKDGVIINEGTLYICKQIATTAYIRHRVADQSYLDTLTVMSL